MMIVVTFVSFLRLGIFLGEMLGGGGGGTVARGTEAEADPRLTNKMAPRRTIRPRKLRLGDARDDDVYLNTIYKEQKKL